MNALLLRHDGAPLQALLLHPQQPLGHDGDDGPLPDALPAAALEDGDGAAPQAPVAALGRHEEEGVQDAERHGEGGGGFGGEGEGGAGGGLELEAVVGEGFHAREHGGEGGEEGVEAGFAGGGDAGLEEEERGLHLHEEAEEGFGFVGGEGGDGGAGGGGAGVVGGWGGGVGVGVVLLIKFLDCGEPGLKGEDGGVAALKPVGWDGGDVPVPIHG